MVFSLSIVKETMMKFSRAFCFPRWKTKGRDFGRRNWIFLNRDHHKRNCHQNFPGMKENFKKISDDEMLIFNLIGKTYWKEDKKLKECTRCCMNNSFGEFEVSIYYQYILHFNYDTKGIKLFLCICSTRRDNETWSVFVRSKTPDCQSSCKIS